MPRFAISLGSIIGCLWAATAAEIPPRPSDYVVRVWSTQEGLPQDAVRALAQTPDGYLWVGTFGGLARFDGKRFEVFTVGNTPELPDNLINALFCDREGRLWIGHDTGRVTVMERRNFRRVTTPPDWQRIPIRSFGENRGGEIWLLNSRWQLAIVTPVGDLQSVAQLNPSDPPFHFDSSAPDGLLRLITERGRCYIASTNGLAHDPDAPPAPSDGRRVVRSASGGYWGKDGNRLCRWVGGKVVETLEEVDWGEAIYATTCEWNGVVAGGSFREGLSLAGRNGSRQRLDGSYELPSHWIAALFVDRDGILWVGTGDAGLAAIRPKRVRILMPPGEAARKHIQSVTAGTGGGVWVATEGAGLFEFDGVSWRQTSDIPGMRLQVYSSLWMARDGGLFASTPGAGTFYLRGGNWRRISEVGRSAGARGALLMTDKDLWVAGSNDLLRFSGNDLTLGERIAGGEGVCCLADDGAGGLWFGGNGTGLGHWTSARKVVLHTEDGLPSENILSLHRTRDGSLWIGTDGFGLARMKDARFGVISKHHGLPSDTVCQMIEDNEGRLWMGTYAGICAVTLQELESCAEGKTEHVKCLVLDSTDGMETVECSAGNQPSVCRTADGRLWFATRRGVAVVSPWSIKMDLQLPSVFIERLQTDGGLVPINKPEGPVILPPGERHVQIGFNAPWLRAAHRVRFRYRLDPTDSGWRDSGEGREITYARVPPGEFRFRVVACNEDGVWDTKEATLAFKVPPFLWERAWFAPLCWAAALGLVGGTAAAFLRQRWRRRLDLLEHQRAVERERSRIARDLHDDLGGSLTEISMLADAIETPAPSSGTEANPAAQISRKSTQLVGALDEIVWAVNPRHDSVVSLVEYLAGNAQEFLGAAGIRLRLDRPRNLPAVPLSPEYRHEVFVAAKEALTNAVRHSKCTEVCIHFKLEPGKLSIVIEDNGCGFGTAAPQGGGDGLMNMRERLEALGGSCWISSQMGTGTRVHLELPNI